MPDPDPIRAVAFDVGNVLLDWDPGALLAAVAGAARLLPDRALEAGRELYGRAKRRLDLGDLGPAAFHVEMNGVIRAAGGREIPYDEFLRIWPTGLGPRPGATALVRRLRPGVEHAIWSNTDPVHFAFWSRWLPLISSARSVWVSFLAGVAKPDRAFYEGGLAALGRRAEEVLFLDDAEENVEAARALGIEAEVVKTLADVEGALGRRGLLP